MKSGTRIDKPSLVYIKNRKLLMARSKNKDKFYIPGGKIRENETQIAALEREVMEELGVRMIKNTAKNIFSLDAQAHGKEKGVICRFFCISADLDGEPKPSSEIEELKYLSTSDAELTPEAGVLILEKLHKLDLID